MSVIPSVVFKQLAFSACQIYILVFWLHPLRGASCASDIDLLCLRQAPFFLPTSILTKIKQKIKTVPFVGQFCICLLWCYPSCSLAWLQLNNPKPGKDFWFWSSLTSSNRYTSWNLAYIKCSLWLKLSGNWAFLQLQIPLNSLALILLLDQDLLEASLIYS